MKKAIKMANAEFTFSSLRKQLFSIPFTVISSMLDNPSSHKGLMKLYQTCKYFYSKRPILIADQLCFAMESAGGPVDVFVYRNDVTNLRTPIWLTDDVDFLYYIKRGQRLPKFYRYSVKKFFLSHSELQYEDFVLLTSEKNVWRFGMSYGDACVYHSDGSTPRIDELLQHLPNVTDFEYFIDEKCTREVCSKLKDLKFNHKFNELQLEIRDVHPTFDLNCFCEFISKNTDDTADEICLCLGDAAREKLKPALRDLDPKWWDEENDALEEFLNNLKK